MLIDIYQRLSEIEYDAIVDPQAQFAVLRSCSLKRQNINMGRMRIRSQLYPGQPNKLKLMRHRDEGGTE